VIQLGAVPYRTIRHISSEHPKRFSSSRSVVSREVRISFAGQKLPAFIFEAARFYENQHQWYPHLLLLMPDHAHLLASSSQETGMRSVVQRWKRYTARHAHVHWQRDFFDHRLRTEESFDEKAAYIRRNPIRARLANKEWDWPYQFRSR
jgi:REP element-mobilizing transposase RayT